MGACAGKPEHPEHPERKASLNVSGTVMGWDDVTTETLSESKEEEDDENENVVRDRTEGGVSERDTTRCTGDMVTRNKVMELIGLRCKSNGGDNEPIGLMGGSICGVLTSSTNSIEEEPAIVTAFDDKEAHHVRKCTSDGYSPNVEEIDDSKQSLYPRISRHVTVQTFRSDMDDVHSMSSNSTRAQVRDAKGLPADFQRFRFYPSSYSFVNQVVQNRLISNTRQPIGAVGLMNLGNTCFMNAALQCLFNCTPLTDYFLGIYWEDEVNSDNVLGHKGEMVKAYARLLESLWSSNSSSVRNPSAFKHTVGSIMPMFSGNEQHDVHEFVAFMLDAMHEDLNRVKGKKPYIKRSEWREEEDEEITARKAWKGYLLRNRSIIVDLFQGQLRSQLRCLYCGYVSVTFDPFMYLSVPLLKADLKKSITLQQCLEYFCEEEALDDKEQWFCPMCKCSVPSVKKFDLWKLPSVLIIHFKRFVYDNKRRRCRNNVNVSFPISSLDLSCFVKSYQREPPHYDLFAVANHHGGKISSGHYTAQTLSRVTNEWNNFNDSNVQPVCASKVSSSNEKAYVLFYSKMRPGMSVKGETTPAKKLKRKYGDNSSRSGRNDAQHRKMGIIRRQSLSKPQDWPHESN